MGVARALGLLLAVAACSAREPRAAAAPSSLVTAPEPAKPAASLEDGMLLAPDIPARLAQLPATRVDYDRRLLDEKETRTLQKLIEASHVLDEIFLRQVSEENPVWRGRLAAAAREGKPGAAEALTYFDVMHGPWDRLKGDEPFVGTRRKPPGAGFYPPDMTKE